MQYRINEIYAELVEQRDFLIMELGTTFEYQDLLKLSGRIYELDKVLKKIEEVEGA